MHNMELKKIAAPADDPDLTGDDIVAALRDMLGVGHVALKLLRFSDAKIYQGHFG